MKMKKTLALLLGGVMAFSLAACGEEEQPAGKTNDEKAIELVDFTVEVEEGRDPVVLQLTDPQIIDAAQERDPNRLGGTLDIIWATDTVEENCYQYIRETVQNTDPDLIIMTGDIIYGQFDDAGTALTDFVEFMESLNTPWAPIMGNHDAETTKGVDWQCEQYTNAKNCLFVQNDLTGNGNYSVGIVQGGKLKRVFYMLDSNSYAEASTETMMNGHSMKTAGFGSDQIAWYTQQILDIKELSKETKFSFAYHIPQRAFKDGFAPYLTASRSVNIDLHPERVWGDFGYIGSGVGGSWDEYDDVWSNMQQLGVDSVFVGHEHENSGSVVYQGIRLQFGQKSSAYDQINWFNTLTGEIVGSTGKPSGGDYIPMVGGTVIPLSKKDGSIKNPYIYLCGFENGILDWSQWV